MDTGLINLHWGRTIVATLLKLGIRHSVVSPGSRSTPLTFSLAESAYMEVVPVLDERSAGFFALGMAKTLGNPVAVICTSGSAVVNLMPAVVEARMAGVPLIVFTADRPPELQDCHAGQTINQKGIFGKFARMYSEVPIPSRESLPALAKLIGEAFQQCLCAAGPVHLNLPFREPLLPSLNDTPKLKEVPPSDDSHFEVGLQKKSILPSVKCSHKRILVIAGAGGPGLHPGWATHVLALARKYHWPLLADPLSGLRNTLEAGRENIVAHYDSILRDQNTAAILRPEAVLQVGTLPTSKVLRRCLAEWDVPGWTVSPLGENFDPIHSDRVRLEIFPSMLEKCLVVPNPAEPFYTQAWSRANMVAETHFQSSIDACGEPFEGKVAWLLNEHLPENTAVHIASSMPIRDVEFFWSKKLKARELFANRGANGIDGTLSTALGISQLREHTLLLTGDLAFLHDRNGLLIPSNSRFKGKLTVVLINNSGGGIFENLPIAKQDPPFEEFFATPQKVDFQKLSESHDFPHHHPESWDAFISLISKPPDTPVRIIELRTDRKRDCLLRQQILKIPKS